MFQPPIAVGLFLLFTFFLGLGACASFSCFLCVFLPSKCCYIMLPYMDTCVCARVVAQPPFLPFLAVSFVVRSLGQCFGFFFLLLRCLYEFLTVICECAWFWHLCIAGSCIFGHRDRDWGFCCLNDPAQFVFIFLLRPYTHTPTWPHTDTRTHTAAAIMAVMGI